MFFLILFVMVPLVELYFMLQVSDSVGAFNTVLLVVMTAIVGGVLVRLQGFSTMMRVREMSARGEAPALEMIEGAILLLCGLMLLLPGFITDAIGFLLLIPPLRKLFVLRMLKRANILKTNTASSVVDEAEFHEVHTRSGRVEERRVIEAENWTKED